MPMLDKLAMQFTGKAPTTGLNDARRDRHEHERINAQVVDALHHDPAFRVWTIDGNHWICPYLGTLVRSAVGSLTEPQAYLFQARPWLARRNAKARPFYQVVEQKWTLCLAGSTAEEYLRFAADGRWLSPDSDEVVQLPRARSARDPRAQREIIAFLSQKSVMNQ